MTRPNSLFLTAGLAGMLALASAIPALAQQNVPWNVALGSYSDTANWMHPFGEDLLPDAGFDEVALIANGGTAFVEDTPEFFPAGLIINSGALEVRNGGNLMVIEGGFGAALGNTTINGGRLVGLSGGSFSTESLNVRIAGTIDLSGTASMTVNGPAQLGGTTRIAGPDVNFSAESLVSTGVFSAGITGPTHSAIDVDGPATIGSSLVLEFAEDVTPEFGDTWDIVDAQSISRGFTSVTANISAGPGLVFTSQIVAGGNGRIAQAAIEPRLVLEVNRRTGQVQMRDVAGIQTTTIDGYSISSPSGGLAPGGWDTFDLAEWIASEADETHVGEVSLTGQRVIGTNEAVDLGSLFANPARTAGFGQVTEDVTFEYTVEGGGVLTGLIDYTDAHNNIVLVVDPDTGDTWIQNQSVFDIQLDGYDILSDAGSLNPGEWVSFASSDNSWTEANPADYHIGELNYSDSMLLAGEGEAINLGQIFTPGSERDLVFTFNTAPSEGEPMTFTGIIEYEEGPIDFDSGMGGIEGDFNSNGLVEQQDLDLVLANWGEPAASAPPTWSNDPPEGNIDQTELDKVLVNWGDTAAATLGVGAVPEPSAGVLALIALAFIAVRSTWARRS